MINQNKATLLNKILSEFSSGDKISALNKLTEYLKNNPNDINARYNHGYMCQHINKLDLAKKSYLIVIKKDMQHWQSRFNIYTIYITEKSYVLALKYIDEVLKIKKEFQPAQRDRALVLNYMKKPDEALPYIISSINKNTKDYLAFNTLGLILISLKKFEEAKKAFLDGIKIAPKYIASYNNLGHCYTLINDKINALKIFKKGLNIEPNSSELLNNIANYYNNNGDYKKGLQFYLKAEEFDKNNPLIMSNIAIAYFNLGKEKESERLYQKSYAMNPNNDLIKKAYSHLLLKQQKYEQAWNIFDGRLKLEEFSFKNTKHDNIKNKLWNSKKKLNRSSKILIVKEQGVGDEILYGSMYADVLQEFPNAIFESDERLIKLFDYSLNKNNKDKFFPFGTFTSEIKKLNNFDTVIYAGSLGRFFRKNISCFPKENFLKIDNKKINEIKSKLSNLKKPKIGISWRSKREHYGEFKSVSLSNLLPILRLKYFDFINLQYGDTAEELVNFNNKNKISIDTIEGVDLFNDFESISGLLKNLDLFITVSNSTAHLAGSLGVPTWLIKPKNHATFFYWNQDNNKTPWYSSIKIYSTKSEYEETILDIKKDLIKKFKIKN
ncbi:MAG: hypothetical protein CFH18_00483 [Alphaproteobacteria bacterium MarineAlpha5_Bin8]|nr:MAG: hypothetical protein CFH17_00130 [Alphaproteobacteria bacterium MarineAlpha5_Bin7]PPR46986.1 MAG: hypothetical protein CFH18_00483 [Alphaproteobacteria bacterium MarineAlpha5_Bin8]PPR54928.1 MAG: hypothetical protein CFH16_00105 [Alphaproteobacteria bacterium MarineAlpha5_Bin6]|tara:strand:+ start:1542 stop:3365 length:1824 start_codon:yes stop_codon:yes gene_type:complete